MNLAELMKRQKPLIQIIVDEVTLRCSRLRGAPVSPEDPEVHQRVCEIILQGGAELGQQTKLA